MNDDNKKPQTHLLYSDRFYIEQALNGNDSITEIATFLNRDISTISKEIKRAIGFRSEHYIAADAQCMATHCRPAHLCGDRTCSTNCRRCPVYDCKDLCGHYETSHCKRLDRPPYVCNPCPSKQACHISKHYYRAADAQRMYEKKLSESRKGINLTPEELKQLNDTVSPLIKKGQPLSHIFAVHSEDIMRTAHSVQLHRPGPA